MGETGAGYSSAERRQRRYARLAGFLFLWLIVTGLTGAILESHIAGSGTLAETAKRVAASERLYRIALCSDLVEATSGAVLAFALYVTLKPADNLLALMAMLWRLGEALLGCVAVIFGFARLDLYLSAQTAGGAEATQLQAVVELTRHVGSATGTISAMLFSLGSILFYYVFYRSRYIPRVLSVFGVFASVVVTMLCVGSLIFPEHAGTLQYGWAPMAIAEVTTGVWLMVFAVKIPAQDGDQQLA